jgi:hypothetical protein
MQHKSAVPIRSGFPYLGSLAPSFVLSLVLSFVLLTQLMGCTVIGGVVGHGRDVAESRTRIVPVAEAASLRKGATVFLTIPNRETLKGRFTALSERDGKKSIHLRTPDGEMKIGLADVTEIAEDYRNHDKLIKGACIGGFLDIVLIGGPVWLIVESNKRAID